MRGRSLNTQTQEGKVLSGKLFCCEKLGKITESFPVEKIRTKMRLFYRGKIVINLVTKAFCIKRPK